MAGDKNVCGDFNKQWWQSAQLARDRSNRNALALSTVLSRFRARRPEPRHSVDVVQIVHDLEDPLEVIALEAAMLDAPAATDGDTMRRSLRRICLNVEYVARVVDDLLDLSAIDDRQLHLRFVRTDLREVIEHV